MGRNEPEAPHSDALRQQLAAILAADVAGYSRLMGADERATVTALGGRNPGAAGGVLNFMGNVGGILSIWAVPRMKDVWGWTTMLGIWAVVAVVAALLWLLVRPKT